ncbi:MAG: zinc ribbon domain-containing protein [Armatimonadota bacterium]
MNERILFLYEVHKIDVQLLKHRMDLQKMAEVDQLKTQAMAALDAFKAVDTKLQAAQRDYRDLDLEVQGMLTKEKSLHRELFSGKITGSKELDNKQKEMELVTKHRVEKEDKMLELMDVIEQLQVEVKPLAEVKDVKVKAYREAAKLADEGKTRIEAEMAALSEARSRAVAKVDKNLLAQYDGVRRRQRGVGMSPLAGGKCGMCRMPIAIATAHSVEEGRVEQCDNCERILFPGH